MNHSQTRQYTDQLSIGKQFFVDSSINKTLIITSLKVENGVN